MKNRVFAIVICLAMAATGLAGCMPEASAPTATESLQPSPAPSSAGNADAHVDEQGYSLGLIAQSNGDGTCRIVGYTGTDNKLFIPDTIDGETVVAFGATTGEDGAVTGTFEGNTSLKELNIPPTVMSIEERAFADCTSLDTMLIPHTVLSIGQDAFAGCEALSSISFEADEQASVNFHYHWNPNNIPVQWADPQGELSLIHI